MAEQEDLAQIRELFNAYVANLNQEFRNHASAKEATDECMRIAVDLMEYGFVILVQTKQSAKTIQPTDNTVQTIIIFEHDIVLVKHEIPMQVPIAVAGATTHIYGPVTIPTGHEHIDERALSPQEEEWLRRIESGISAKDEQWLRNVLDSLGNV